MAPRANWNGHLKLRALTCPISLYPAYSKKERVSFNIIDRETKTQLKQQYVHPGTMEVVEKENRARGYPIAKKDFLIVEDDELAALKCEVDKTIEITQFVKKEQVNIRYYDAPYFITPNDKVGYEAFTIIRESMFQKDVVGIASVVIGRRERPIMLLPYGKGIMGITLHFHYEVREATMFDEIPAMTLPKDYADLGEKLVKTMTKSAFNLATIEDRYENELVDLIRNKQKGYTPLPKEEPKPSPAKWGIKELLAFSVKEATDASHKEARIETVKEAEKATVKPPAPAVKAKRPTKKAA